jgi:hypothetical protein
MKQMWHCSVCGEIHEGLPISFAADFPDMFANLTREQRQSRTIIGSDQCIVDQTWFFIRGCLEIPISGEADPFLWGLWANVKEEVYDEISESWTSEGREKSRGPYKGRLANSLSVYPETLNLKLTIRMQPVGSRPLLIIDELDHPLSVEQQVGITAERASELASLLLHQQGGHR